MDTFSACLKSVGAGVLTLVLLGGLGYFAYTSLFVAPQGKTDEVVAVHTMTSAQPNEKVTVDANKKPS